MILDQSAFYPTSGGQQNDTGKIWIDGMGDLEVVDVIKVGKCVLHQISQDVPDDVDLVGKAVKGEVNLERRTQLQAHHTGTHIVFASCRRILGPHIW